MDGSSNFKIGVHKVPQSSDPSNPIEGDEFYADGTSRTEGLWTYNGSAWEKVGDPTTTTGDIIYNNGTTAVRLSVGSSGDVCTVSGGIPSWAAPAEALESVTAKTTTYTALTSDDLITCDASSGAFTVTLYTASGNTGRKLKIKKIDSGTNAVTIDGSGSETLDGNLTRKLCTENEIIEIQSDGTNWLILDRGGINTTWADYTPTNQGLGSATFPLAQWRRIGDSIEINIKGQTGTVTASELQLGIPNSWTIATNTGGSVLYKVGDYHRVTSTVNHYSALATPGDAFFNVGTRATGDNLYLTAQNGNGISGSSEEFTLNAVVKITDWESF